MIKKIDPENIPRSVIEYLYKDPARNYFILLGILDKRQVFKNIYLQYKDDAISSVLFERISGSLQFYSDQVYDSAEIRDLIASLDYNSLISPDSYSHYLYDTKLFSKLEKIAYICRLKSEDFRISADEVIKSSGLNRNLEVTVNKNDLTLKPLDISMMDEVEKLYKEVFRAYASRSVMQSRLSDTRGRGYVLYDNDRLVSAVQSEFETAKSAVIVGVATSRDFQKNGLAGFLLEQICAELLAEGKDLYLQFDNPDAGRIYYKLGFKDFDRVVHYYK